MNRCTTTSDGFELQPGDAIFSLKHLKPVDLTTAERINELERILPGTHALVVNVAPIGKRVRILVLIEGRLSLFSHKRHTVRLNWSKKAPTSF